jgi:hypothetical protein
MAMMVGAMLIFGDAVRGGEPPADAYDVRAARCSLSTSDGWAARSTYCR